MQRTKFTYGDAVRIIDKQHIKEPEHDSGSILAITVVVSECLSNLYKEPIGTIMYHVEFRDGSSGNVPERALQLLQEAHP